MAQQPEQSVARVHEAPGRRLQPSSPADLVYAAELIKAVGGDIAQLAKIQNEGLGQLDTLTKQLAYVREVMDYSLFVTPTQAEKDDDLYPFSIWLREQFSGITRQIAEQARLLNERPSKEPEETQALADAVQMELGRIETVLREGLAAVERAATDLPHHDVIQQTVERVLNERLGVVTQQLEDTTGAVTGRLDHAYEALVRIERQQGEQAKLLKAQGEIIAQQRNLTPYDDFDVQVEELRDLIKSQTTRWRLYENIFYGLVVFMLLANTMLLVWLNLRW
ncbi:MAG: hypothetical protein KDD69_13310 [Bdellovibrionales bacterium]|nr:hypothetical protein [Bdellovibrionales bacterium]